MELPLLILPLSPLLTKRKDEDDFSIEKLRSVFRDAPSESLVGADGEVRRVKGFGEGTFAIKKFKDENVAKKEYDMHSKVYRFCNGVVTNPVAIAENFTLQQWACSDSASVMTFSDFLKQRPPTFPPGIRKVWKEKATEVFAQLGRGLRCIHNSGVKHGDLNPRNVIMCTESGESVTKIIDFGHSSVLSVRKPTDFDDEFKIMLNWFLEVTVSWTDFDKLTTHFTNAAKSAYAY